MLMTVGLILLAVGGLVSLWRQLQMLQQNSYFPSRYYGWMKESYVFEVTAECFAFCLAAFLYEKALALLIAAAVLLAVRLILAVSQHRKSIKKLVVTGRVKRLYGAAILVFALLVAGYVLADGQTQMILRMLIAMFGLVTPLTALLSWLLTKPIESTFTAYYIRDAKRILKEHSGITVIGVTGSYGKTTTKFILQRLLDEKFNVVTTPHSFNTPMGVVRTIRGDIKPETQIFICEMGAKKTGDIKEICDIVHPDHGIITSVGPQHLDTFHSVDNVFATKFELYDAVTQKGGKLFANAESAGIAERVAKCPKALLFGGDSECRAENVTCGREGSSFDLVLFGERVPVKTRLLGAHAVNDIVAAASLAKALGVSAEEIRFAVSALKPTEHRLEMKSWQKGSVLIDDAYNANPEGCLAAAEVLGSFDGMVKTIITPGLIELGTKEYECNFNLGAKAAEVCDEIILVGKNRSKPLHEGALSKGFDEAHIHVVSSFAEAMQVYLPTVSPNHVVLLENDLPDNYLN